jgi:hypothetical protein
MDDSGVMVSKSGRWLMKILIEPNEAIYPLRKLSLMEVRSTETLNIKIVGKSVRFLKRVETQNFDIGRRNNEALKLIGFSR